MGAPPGPGGCCGVSCGGSAAVAAAEGGCGCCCGELRAGAAQPAALPGKVPCSTSETPPVSSRRTHMPVWGGGGSAAWRATPDMLRPGPGMGPEGCAATSAHRMCARRAKKLPAKLAIKLDAGPRCAAAWPVPAGGLVVPGEVPSAPAGAAWAWPRSCKGVFARCSNVDLIHQWHQVVAFSCKKERGRRV